MCGWISALGCALVAVAAQGGMAEAPVGFPSRASDLDVLPGFRDPPPGYGEVAFYWWLGDPLTRERLTWQLDRLAGKGVTGLQVNYAHSDRGGSSWGLTFPSEPPLFSEEWWQLFGWFLREAKARGMAASLSDYTLGVGQGWAVDEALREHPEIQGSVLEGAARDLGGGERLEWELPAEPLAVRAYPRAGEAIAEGPSLDLTPAVADRAVSWSAPEGSWRVLAVWARPVRPSIDPMHPGSGRAMVEHFFQPFEDRNPGEAGKGLNFFFSDELGFGLRGWLWNGRFAEEFARRKGYDLVAELPSLLFDTGPRTPKVRLDASDVMVSLSEEGYFRPVYEWHQQRGMIYGCDHGGRGYDLTEFGDYFRTQRWNQGPGCDQPGLGRDVVKNKVASSLAHLYERPRVWLEGYYGSGWGTSSAQVAEATFANFAMGQNLLTLHGLYYSTHGGWWEWAPPCNHWRMPYWEHMGTLLGCTERLSYLLSQGVHVCDVAVLYPVAALEAGMPGRAAETAFDVGRRLYASGADFDYMDWESLARAEIADGKLSVAGESYRVLILPAMEAVRHSTLQKAADFARAGGIVLAVGALPSASDLAGRGDPAVEELVRATFAPGGPGLFVPGAEDAVRFVHERITADIAAQPDGAWEFLHRRAGGREIYALHGLPEGSECTLRATGRLELWDPWTGETRPLPVLEQTAEHTRLRLPGAREEMQLLVFSPGTPELDEGAPPPAVTEIALEGEWESEPVPTLDNRFGDFRWPPSEGAIGPEARILSYRADSDPADAWSRAACGYGPMFLKLGPLPAGADPAQEDRWAREGAIREGALEEVGGRPYAWQPYEFSWRAGVEGDPGHQGYHGLKEETYAEFLRLGRLADRHTDYVREPEEGGTGYYLRTTVRAPRAMRARIVSGGMLPRAVWVGGRRLRDGATRVELAEGPSTLLLRYEGPGTGYFALATPESDLPTSAAHATAFAPDTRWVWSPEGGKSGAARFRKVVSLDTAPAEARVRVTGDDGYTLRVNGTEVGAGASWTTVQSWDVASLLHAGENVVEIDARNAGGEAGLIAEVLLGSGGDLRRIGTDASWETRLLPDGDATAAREIAPFVGSLWFEHPQGPPKLAAEPGPLAPTVGSLTSPWWGRQDVLPFDVTPGDAPQLGEYRFAAPPGAREFTATVLGDARAWIDGTECPRRVREADSEPSGRAPGQPAERRVTFRLPQEAPRGASVTLRVTHEPGWYGGAAIPEPIAFRCGPGLLPTGDWSQVGGLDYYSGGMWYRRSLRLDAETARSRVVLDLGSVVSSAEVRLNGASLGVRVAPPWRWELTGHLREGDNRLEVLVYNTLANHYRTIPTRYQGSPASGILGPARLRVSRP